MSADDQGRERADDEVDAAWADIVARLGPLGAPGPDEVERPADRREDGQGHHDGRVADVGPPPRTAPRASGPRDHSPGDGDDDGEVAGDEEARFVPEDPAPLRGAGLAWWAPWLALVGAPVLLGVVGLARGSVPTWLVLAAVLTFAGGAVAAVLRLPARSDDGDDGAVL